MDLHQPVDPNKTMEELTPQERMRLEHMKMHEKHKGHEAMHLEMILILIFTLLVAQIVLVEWKKRHYKSYALISLIGLWTIPLIISAKSLWYRFIIIWLIFSISSIFIIRKSVSKPILGNTPRLVYKFFFAIYKLSYALGIIGYMIMMMTFVGINLIFKQEPHIWMDTGLLFIFYGLYFGVLGRDLSEICTERIAAHVGYYTKTGIPNKHLGKNVCAVCGNQLLVAEGDVGIIENTYRLSCDHVFHEYCIRGWCIIGKKQTCPYCKEKVDLKKLFCNPWEKPHMLYGQLLDFLRYLIAWQPVIFVFVQGINWILGLE